MKLRTRQKIFGLIFIFPFFTGCLIFYFIPFLISLYYSITDGFGSRSFAGFDNYIRLFRSEAFLMALKNTVVFMVIALPLVITVSLFTGMLVYSLGRSGRLCQMLFLLPMIVPTASIIKVWQIIFERQGILNHVLCRLNIAERDFMKGGWAVMVVILIFVWKNFGYLSLLYAVALSAMPKEAVESARIDGAGKVKVFTKLTLPFLRPTTFFVMLLSIINAFKIFREVFLLAGEYPDMSIYFVQHYINNNFYNLNFQNLSAASTILTVCITAVVAVVFRKEKKSAYME